MVKTVVILLASICLTASAQQSVDGYLSIAFGHHKNGQLDSAELYYGKAIRLADTSAIARFNRANIYYGKKEFDKTMADVQRTLALKPTYDQALYMRANLYAMNDETDKALADAEKLVQVNPQYMGVYSLRGQIYFRMGNAAKACADFLTGKDKKEPDADALYNDYCLGLAPDGTPLPEELERNFADGGAAWVESYKSDTKEMLQLRYVREGNSLDAAQEAISVIIQKNVRGIVPLDTIMNFMANQVMNDSKNATKKVIERDNSSAFPRLFFTVSNPDSTDKIVPQSQVYCVIKSHNAIYTMIWNIARPSLKNEEIQKWIAIFKKQRLLISQPVRGIDINAPSNKKSKKK
ncbi:MAG: tetratricopeptide repeat protein [Candidatus Kapaibacterium sp.]|jgi:tetratricopeptide (TPR) repeat protein